MKPVKHQEDLITAIAAARTAWILTNVDQQDSRAFLPEQIAASRDDHGGSEDLVRLGVKWVWVTEQANMTNESKRA